MRHFVAAFAALSLFTAAIAADSSSSDPDQLGVVVVTATRTATSIDTLAVPVIVIDRAEIERTLALDAAELLSARAGLEVARNGGPGQPASLFIRGTESNHSTVLVDGVRINPGSIGGAALQNVLPESIERIEVVKGARSTLYGTDAIGGVVNIITRAGAARGASASAAGGRYGLQQYALDGGADFGATLHAGGSVAYQKSDGFAPQVNSRLARGYRNGSTNLRLSAAPTDAWHVALQLWNAQGNSEYLGYDRNFNFGPLDQDYRNTALAASASYQAERWQWKTLLSHAIDNIDQRQPPDYARTRRDTLDTQLGFTAGAQQLTAGAVLGREHVDSQSFGTLFKVRTDTRLLYAQHQLHLGSNELLLAIGNTHHETFGNHSTWNAEYSRAVGSDWHLSAAAGTAFHAPDSTDRFGYGGNPKLEPELSRQVELGLRWRHGGQSVQLSAFDTRIDSLILFVLTDPANFVYTNRNVERARIRGVELSYELHRAPWTLSTSATVQDPRNESSHEQLLRRARLHADLRLAHQSGRLTASATLSVSGAREDVSFPSNVTLPGYTLLNAGIDYQLLPEWSVQLRVDNALDREYQLVYGYNTPQRSLMLGTRYRFK
jgi:vitamin B12 transporter